MKYGRTRSLKGQFLVTVDGNLNTKVVQDEEKAYTLII
jgi:hypothetical protein